MHTNTTETLALKLGSRINIRFNNPWTENLQETLSVNENYLLETFMLNKTLPHNWIVIDHTRAAQSGIAIGTFVKAISKYKKLKVLTPLSTLCPMTQREKARLIALHEEVLGQKWLSSTKIYFVSPTLIWTGGIAEDSNALYNLKSYNDIITYESMLYSIKEMTTKSLLFPDLTPNL